MASFTIILPQNGENKEDFSDVHSDLVEQLVRKFGNCNATAGISFYRSMKTKHSTDTGKILNFDVVHYIVLCEVDTGLTKYITDTAKEFGKLCKVENVAIFLPQGHARYIAVT